MMKKYILFVLCLSLGVFSSCLKNDDMDNNQILEEQMERDETIIKNFLATNDIDAVRHESGVYYQIILPGEGSYNYRDNPNPFITINYIGKLLNGVVFDQTRNTPYEQFLGNLILGWRIGVPLIQKGGKIRLIIPSYFAYGPQAAGSIPPNSVLDFEIELLDIK